MPGQTVVLDTNVFVAAGFNPDSASARIVEAVREGRLRMVWTEATRAETRAVLRRIPPLAWATFAETFRAEDRFRGEVRSEDFAAVPDPPDRKFLALASAAGAVLVSADDHLLRMQGESEVLILAPGAYWAGSMA